MGGWRGVTAAGAGAAQVAGGRDGTVRGTQVRSQSLVFSPSWSVGAQLHRVEDQRTGEVGPLGRKRGAAAPEPAAAGSGLAADWKMKEP